MQYTYSSYCNHALYNFSTYIDIHGVCVYYIHVLNTIFSKLLQCNNAKKIVNSDVAENVLYYLLLLQFTHLFADKQNLTNKFNLLIITGIKLHYVHLTRLSKFLNSVTTFFL